MKIILSRKGFDSAAGGAPSPIVGGRPISLPIPATTNSRTRYADIGLGDLVEQATRKRLSADALCHHDPMFVGGECLFGQTGAAQSHLERHGIGPGDIFLFFGLFREEATRERHHRFFGFLRIATMHHAASLSGEEQAALHRLGHPHALGQWHGNDMIYRGSGQCAGRDHPELRLTRPGGPLSQWRVPPWLNERGLSYHGKARRWAIPGELTAVSRGQEFVCDIGEDPAAHAWVDEVVRRIID